MRIWTKYVTDASTLFVRKPKGEDVDINFGRPQIDRSWMIGNSVHKLL